jgi:AraC-like DNA-binding protein
VTDLLATLIAELAGDTMAVQSDDPRRELVLRVRQYINHHLGDQELTPEMIADAHRISVRYLHRIFEGEGTSVSRLVQQRRLEECRRELARRAPVNRTVSAVATLPGHLPRLRPLASASLRCAAVDRRRIEAVHIR